MNNKIKTILFSLSACTLIACSEQGVEPAQNIKKPTVELSPEAKAGASLYMSSGCIGCHGAAGQSRNASSFPVLAGKEASFIKEQLVAFKNYSRRNSMMNPVAARLEESDMDNLAAYLSVQ